MASGLTNTTPQRLSQQPDFARLIPGEVPAFRASFKKPSQSVRSIHGSVETSQQNAETLPESVVRLLLPSPLRSRSAWEWLGSLVADCVLITLNWLILGALMVSLHDLFPRVRLFEVATWSYTFLLGIALLHIALITLVGYTEGLYASAGDLRAQRKALGKSVLLGTMLLCLTYALQGVPLAIVGLICLAGLLHFAGLWTWRWRSEKREEVCPKDGRARRVLIVGAGPVGRNAAFYFERHPGCGRRICGFLDDERAMGNGVLGRVSDLALVARKEFVDEVILAAPRDRDLAQRVLREAKRLRLDLEIIPELFGCDSDGQEIERVGGLPMIHMHAERLPTAGLVVKRIIDLLGAAAGLTLCSPLLVVVALLIKFDSPGPVLYIAQRAGRKGLRFNCYKFRTMVSDADRLKESLRHKNERSGPIFKIADDPRITRLGRFLRRSSLDELPQLWNVLRGEMSLVGPRPHPVDEFAAYELSHLGRLDVTPGLTGLWQISARRDPSFDRAMALDREYIGTWSLGLDLQILLKTVVAVARGSGN